MKKLFPFFVVLLIFNCKSSTVVMNNDDPSQNIIPEPSKNDVIMTSTTEANIAQLLCEMLDLSDGLLVQAEEVSK